MEQVDLNDGQVSHQQIQGRVELVVVEARDLSVLEVIRRMHQLSVQLLLLRLVARGTNLEITIDLGWIDEGGLDHFGVSTGQQGWWCYLLILLGFSHKEIECLRVYKQATAWLQSTIQFALF
jgi:hypothetical protein